MEAATWNLFTTETFYGKTGNRIRDLVINSQSCDQKAH